MLDIEAASCFLQPPMVSFKKTSLGLRGTHLKAESKRENVTLLREVFSALLAKLDRYPKEPKGQESGAFQSWRNQILLKILLNWEQKQGTRSIAEERIHLGPVLLFLGLIGQGWGQRKCHRHGYWCVLEPGSHPNCPQLILEQVLRGGM